MHRYMFSLMKKKGDMTFSISAIANFILFRKLVDINRSWRNQFFIIEHELNFLDIPIVWANEAHIMKRSSKFIEDELPFLAELYAQCLIFYPSADYYVQCFILRHDHPADVGTYDVIGGGVLESEGIF